MHGIWQFENKLNPVVAREFQLSLNEGNTPLQTFTINNDLYFKREDLNPSGSQKDRSLAFQISALMQKGILKYCISSSGNAAISACAYFNEIKSESKHLDVFVSKTIVQDKLERLNFFRNNNAQINIHKSKIPKKDCFLFAKLNNVYNLRGSLDELAIEGFKTIGYELQRELIDCDAIFLSMSSATTLMGIYQSYADSCPALHGVQTSKVHPIASVFDKDFIPQTHSLSSAITDIIAHRKNEAIKAIKSTNGYGWVIEEEEIMKSYELIQSHGLMVSYDSALAIAGYLKSISKFHYNKPVILLTGK